MASTDSSGGFKLPGHIAPAPASSAPVPPDPDDTECTDESSSEPEKKSLRKRLTKRFTTRDHKLRGSWLWFIKIGVICAVVYALWSLFLGPLLSPGDDNAAKQSTPKIRTNVDASQGAEAQDKGDTLILSSAAGDITIKLDGKRIVGVKMSDKAFGTSNTTEDSDTTVYIGNGTLPGPNEVSDAIGVQRCGKQNCDFDTPVDLCSAGTWVYATMNIADPNDPKSTLHKEESWQEARLTGSKC